jgi:hypothetical protein
MRLSSLSLALATCLVVLGSLGCQSTSQSEAKPPRTALRKRPPKFKPTPLAELPDQGVLKAQRLGRPVSRLTKLCPPAKKNRETGTACVCPALGEPTQLDGWTDDSAACTAAAEGIEQPFLNVQFLAAQKTTRARRSEELALDVQFRLLMQTKKGWSTFEIGSTTMEPALGYPRSLTLVSRTFAELLPGGKSKALLAVFNDERTEVLENGEKEQTSTGWLLVCGADAAQKLSCAEPLSLGERRKQGYVLEPIVEGGALYLQETFARTPPALKKTVGKYSFELAGA